MKKTLVFIICLLAAVTLGYGQTLLYYWNFNTGTPATDQSWAQPIPAAIGNANLTYTFTEAFSFGGTLFNGTDGEVVGGSFAPRGGIGTVNNGAYFTMMASTVGFDSISLSYPTRKTSTGFSTHEIKYTLNGTTWVTKETVDISSYTSAWVETQMLSFDFSSIAGVANNANFGIRVVLNGATSDVGNNRIDNIRISGALQGGVATPVFNPPGGYFVQPVNVAITTTTPNATIRYTTNGMEPTASSTQYTTPIPVTSTTTIKAKGFATGMVTSVTATATYSFATVVGSLSELREMPVGDTVYHLPNEVILTWKQSNHKYVQDGSAGIYVYDTAGIIPQAPYNIGDGISGLTGKLVLYFQTLEFVPVSNPGAPTSTLNTIIIPTVTIAQLVSDYGIGQYQSRVVRINQVHFDSPSGNYPISQSVNYPISDATGSMTFRTGFWDADYMGTPMHTGTFNLQGIIANYSETDPSQITPRGLSDFNPATVPDPFGTPTVLPTSMTVMAGVTTGGVPASNGDVLAAYVSVGGIPQLRGKQTIQVIAGVAGCMLQVYTESNGEVISFKVWDASANEVISSSTPLASIVNGTVGSLQSPYMINAAASLTQTITLGSGWNLISLNVSPEDHGISTLIASITANVQQIKGTEGVYIPNNPFSTLTSLTDGKAYNILLNTTTSWSVTGIPITITTPLALLDGWNMVAYLPQSALPVATAIQSISSWLLQVKGTDGVYIPNNPFSTLTTMSPNKGYWIKLSGAHNLVYPGGSKEVISLCESSTAIPVTILSSSMTVLATCEAAEAGDILLAKVGDETRGAERFITASGNTAVLIQIYTETAGEEITFSILKPDGSELPLITTISSQPQETIGTYPNFLILEQKAAGEELLTIPTSLNGCYPNPFNPSTTISFSVAEDNSNVSFDIYNIRGQKIHTYHIEYLTKGMHSITWNGKDNHGREVSSGIYLLQMKSDSYQGCIRMLLSK